MHYKEFGKIFDPKISLHRGTTFEKIPNWSEKNGCLEAGTAVQSEMDKTNLETIGAFSFLFFEKGALFRGKGGPPVLE